MITPPLDGNSAAALPAARGSELAPRGECSYPEETAGRCLSPDDAAPHGNARHIRSAPEARRSRAQVRPESVGEVSVLCLICRMALRSTDIVAVLALLCVLVAAYAALKWP
jgi:hypothetical protein